MPQSKSANEHEGGQANRPTLPSATFGDLGKLIAVAGLVLGVSYGVGWASFTRFMDTFGVGTFTPPRERCVAAGLVYLVLTSLIIVIDKGILTSVGYRKPLGWFLLIIGLYQVSPKGLVGSFVFSSNGATVPYFLYISTALTLSISQHLDLWHLQSTFRWLQTRGTEEYVNVVGLTMVIGMGLANVGAFVRMHPYIASPGLGGIKVDPVQLTTADQTNQRVLLLYQDDESLLYADFDSADEFEQGRQQADGLLGHIHRIERSAIVRVSNR